jgi:hypothetical protein
VPTTFVPNLNPGGRVIRVIKAYRYRPVIKTIGNTFMTEGIPTEPNGRILFAITKGGGRADECPARLIFE